MTPTYSTEAVLTAARETVEQVKAERERRCAAWDAHSWLWYVVNVFKFMEYQARPDYYGQRQEETAQRLIFKAQFCREQSICLSDHEIDCIQQYWGN